MAMNIKIVFVMLSVLLLLTACGKQAAPAPKLEAPPAQTAPATPPAIAEQPPAAEDTTVSEIESSTQEVDQISKDLDTSGIDSIDVELAEIDKLELS